MKYFYGFTVINHKMHVKIIVHQPTWWEAIWWALRDFWSSIFLPSLLVACSVTAFRIAFGLL